MRLFARKPRLLLPQFRLLPPLRERGLLSPFACGFGKVITNYSAPSTTPGTSITPGINDAMGSFTEFISDTLVTEDCYGIWLNFHTSNGSAAARPILVDIGADPAGGTAYANIISSLNAACAWTWSSAAAPAGHFYYFPLFIKAGTALAARAQVGNATALTLRVVARLFAKPKRPELLRCGAYVDAIGIDTVNSRGTAITPGASSVEGAAWVSLGTLPRPAWWFQAGFSVDDSTMTAGAMNLDIYTGDASNKVPIISDMAFFTGGSEIISGEIYNSMDAHQELASGAELFARASFSGSPVDSNNSAMAYALGG